MTIRNIKEWFAQAFPEPTEKQKSVQIGCHYEEVAEMSAAFDDVRAQWPLEDAAHDYKRNRRPLNVVRVDDKVLLDALADQIVTAIGVAHMFGLDIEGALEEVNRSNWSKFVDGKPVLDANGKISKPASYSPPDLSKFV